MSDLLADALDMWRASLTDASPLYAGDQFALFEAVTALAVLVRRFEFSMAAAAPPVSMETVRIVISC